MQNIEIKMRVPDLAAIDVRSRDLGAQYQWTQRLTDTYFRVHQGRLKLRECDREESAMLISYARPDEESSRISQYRLLPVSEMETLRQMLTETLGLLTVVEKTRSLLLFGHTRIHLDDVSGLGRFVELETVLADQATNHAWSEHREVLEALQLVEHEPVPFSYSDLMIRN